jgi:hypothetical protein
MTTSIYKKLNNGKDGTIFKSENIVETNYVVCDKKILENEIVYRADGLHNYRSLVHTVDYLNNYLDSIIWQWPL